MKQNAFLICPMDDAQTGHYIHDTLVAMDYGVAFFDPRQAMKELGTVEKMNQMLVTVYEQLKPDITFLIKGTEIFAETIKKCKEKHTAPIVGWIFDVTLGGQLVQDTPQYVSLLKELDIFYTIDDDAIEPLKKLGVNAQWLTEGCFPPEHEEVVLNSIQKKKYSADVVFLGSVGGVHPTRSKLLQRLHDEGIDFKLYGEVYYPENGEPEFVKDHHTGLAAINDYHSIICESAKIVIGIDGWPERSKSWSARLYRTLCAGGFYLTTATKGLETEFIPGVHLDTFKDEDEMMSKILYYLTDGEEKRQEIALAGQKLVLEKHTFRDRITQMEKNLETLKK